jgi:hypothetical protein
VKSLRREREGFEPPRSALGYFGIAPSTLKVFRVAYLTDLCRRLLIFAVPQAFALAMLSNSTITTRFGGDAPCLLPTEMRRLKQLEDENNKLRKVVADLSLDKEMLQDALRRKL